MWYKLCRREELLELIERDGSSEIVAYDTYPFERFTELPIVHSQSLAYWKDDPRKGSSIPTGVVVDSNELRDFIAWVATYISLRPFSAYCRILESETIEDLAQIREPTLGQLENCYLGIILAECARKSPTPEGMKRLSPAECEGTLSFALARSIALGPGALMFGRIEAQWRKAGKLISPLVDSNDTGLILRIFRIANALSKSELVNAGDDPILDCARDISRFGEIRDNNWNYLTMEHPELRGAFNIQKLRREERVQRLRNIVDSPLRANNALLSFAIGYLGSTIAPGTFDHYATMRELESRVPGVVLWYGFCAGLYKKSSLQSFSGGVGRRVVRDLERNDSVYARPYCDIAINELEVLLGADKRFDFKLGLPGTIEIELAPCITTFHTLQHKPTERPEDVDELLRELDYKLQELVRVRNKINQVIKPPQQKPLFSTSRARRS
jgi:hypothetical protein